MENPAVDRTAAELVAWLSTRQVELQVEGDRLRFHAPPGALTPQLRNELVRRKAEILLHLRQSAERRSARFAKLLEPVHLGRLELPNRIVLSPMEVDLGSRDGTVTDRAVAYYAERARGGAGLLVVEATCVDAAEGLISPNELRADADAAIPGLRRLARAIQSHGARAALQLQHAGRKASSLITGRQPVAPSVVETHAGEVPRELSRQEIAALVERYGHAATRVQAAGFDAVEIHAAHGYLLSQFLSPFYNRRQDEYGGSVENRARLLLAVVAAVRQRLGPAFPVLCRLSAAELEVAGGIRPLAGGGTLEETLEVARLLEAAGVTALDISATVVGLPRMHPMAWPEGFLVPSAEAVRRAVSIPVSVTSRVTPELAEQAIAEGRLDLVRLGRALIADPWLPRKLAEGRREDATPCIFCSVCLDPRLRQPEAVCAVNPLLGREGEMAVTPAAARRRVVVIGGGPAGMEAARIAASRGHAVRLFEQEERLGGQLLLASKPPEAQRTLEELVRFQARQLEKLGVEVRLGERFTPERLEAERPGAVVLATGSRAVRPALPGADLPCVLTAIDVFRGTGVPDGEIVVVGAELVGCEVALRLAAAGRRVTLLGRSRDIATHAVLDVRAFLLWELERLGVAAHSRAEVEEIRPAAVVFRDARGQRCTLPAHRVILATGGRPNDDFLPELAARVQAVFPIGDCSRPRGIREAIREGFEVGCTL
jgi:2,4-dienoyl-CoA reductase-like NADH-dependent reductase (Old Yellow Enzyme family)/thioredoxin reductase